MTTIETLRCTNMDDTIKIQVCGVPTELWRQVKRAALDADMTVQAYVRLVLLEAVRTRAFRQVRKP